MISYTNDLEAHKREHRAFVSQIEEFSNMLEARKITISIRVTKFLKNWLINHIQKTDKQYTASFNSNNVA